MTESAKILFLAMKDNAATRMAKAFADAVAPPGVRIESAGLEQVSVLPAGVAAVMEEAGIGISGKKPVMLDQLGELDFDLVITLSRMGTDGLAALPGMPERIDWNLEEPGDDIGELRVLRDRIKTLVNDFFAHGYFDGIVRIRKTIGIILDNVSDGILAHDLQRRIFYFNRGAERITGYSRHEVLNRDCHDVFPGGLCGPKCSFCQEDESPPDFETIYKDMDITARDGAARRVKMTVKPLFDPPDRRIGVVASFHDITEERRLARRAGEVERFAGIIGRDSKMLEIYELVNELAQSNVPVMIQGESGTGKELVAAAIHNEGPRAGRLFVPVNCGALPESLLESELFGHVRGAFTGALRDKKGRFEIADGGTIFLDEIGDISPAMQVKLLRVLQEGTFERVGSEKTIRVDVRIISATNKDIASEISEKRFREDLYYRLSVVPVTLPPLRERRGDIPLIAEHMLSRVLNEIKRPGVRISPEAMDIMISYDWPGNVRELYNWIQFAMVKCRGEIIMPLHLPPHLHRGVGRGSHAVVTRKRRKLEVAEVRRTLERTGNNRVSAAKELGVSRATLYRFLDENGM